MRQVNGKWLPTVTHSEIFGFFDQYRFLSNFHPLPQPIVYDGIPFWTTEAAYMSAKTDDAEIIMQLHQLGPNDGKLAKNIGSNLKLRDDWISCRDQVMLEVNRLKYAIPDLGTALLATGAKYLEETNYWKDVYWGVCNGVGQNQLGKTLMLVREELQFQPVVYNY